MANICCQMTNLVHEEIIYGIALCAKALKCDGLKLIGQKMIFQMEFTPAWIVSATSRRLYFALIINVRTIFVKLLANARMEQFLSSLMRSYAYLQCLLQ